MPLLSQQPWASNSLEKYQTVPNPSEERPSDTDETVSSDITLLEKEIQDVRRRDSYYGRYSRIIQFNGLVFLFYIATIFLIVKHFRTRALNGLNLIHSPVYNVITWQEQAYNETDTHHGPFSGYPRPEIDENWHELLTAYNIELEPEIMQRFGREDTGVKVPGSDKYIGTLNVFHELHCIKRLYSYSYPEVYWADLSEKQREVNRIHNEHCLDFLRQAAMCHGDIGIVTYEWSEDSLMPVTNQTTHQCIDWKKLDDWSKERSVDMMRPGWLIHPTKGPAYPDGEGSRLGVFKGADEALSHGH
ncbi:hypothetical protein EYC80_004494 [Monilinia laxa]|uniref:Tat pathway signal sequence n=1 Tax=Monilinia laxa TaxID=61186 RepID=A0A5N6KGY0_MONLA|nr:hypothetical protein EYC80_004494 [Monilinia laxa]